jgi:hypothetical protein
MSTCGRCKKTNVAEMRDLGTQWSDLCNNESSDNPSFTIVLDNSIVVACREDKKTKIRSGSHCHGVLEAESLRFNVVCPSPAHHSVITSSII